MKSLNKHFCNNSIHSMKPHCANFNLRLSRIGFSISIAISGFVSTLPVYATPGQSGQFNTQFLKNGGEGVDLVDFLEGNQVSPGVYRVDIVVNRELISRRDVSFAKNGAGRVEACLTLETLQVAGVETTTLAKNAQGDTSDTERCYDLPGLIAQSQVDYDPNTMRLMLSVPQLAMSRKAKGHVDPELWDAGVTAAFIDYNFSTRRVAADEKSSRSHYLGLRNGFNFGQWRVRNESFFTQGTLTERRFESDRTFVQRDITSLKSQLSLGTSYTHSQIFDSVRIKGMTLASDEAMLPDSQRGYAPAIRGNAETNATVEIRQNGYLLSSINVPPGPFLIDDVYPSGSNGDLQVTIIEADGRRRDFSQAFASLPQMVRRGMYRYNVAAGKYESNYRPDVSPMVFTTGLTYGLTDDISVSGGVQHAPLYRATNLGVSQNTAFGAFSADMTYSRSTAGGKNSTGKVLDITSTGRSLRLLYAKTLTATNTTFSLASYRYSTEGFRTLSDHVADQRDSWERLNYGQIRSRIDLNLHQNFQQRHYGSLYLNLSERRFWNQSARAQQYQVGYNNQWGRVSYDIGATYTRYPLRNELDGQKRITFSISLPLGSGSYAPNSRTSFNSDNGRSSLQTGISGNVPGIEDSYYGVQAGHEGGAGNTGSVNLSGLTPVSRIDLGYSHGAHYRTTNLGAAGSVVAHGGGINLGQSLGESFGLVQISDAPGARLEGNHTATVGRNGFAILPSTQPYRTNWVGLDLTQSTANIDISNSTQQLIPRRGAVTLSTFNGSNGHRVQLEIVRANGQPMPFGASVETTQGKQLTVTDPGGRALVMLKQPKGELNIKAGGQTCTVRYALDQTPPKSGYQTMRVECN
ncbi:putative outer membrane usher protein ElfC [Pseudomonas fluorescens]|uniref:fimbria/pilus outer membrane usher protein n=1 Tax=Pseudomonas fluorescens TaxID=294 RepID=UPI00123F138A|nr:fimbria/pilus outer membrane usher protein [Pseudomonas fluorescens]VVP32885.1 putative outer membrane usher protein ElfC [Pseudomonas fluorescens]